MEKNQIENGVEIPAIITTVRHSRKNREIAKIFKPKKTKKWHALKIMP